MKTIYFIVLIGAIMAVQPLAGKAIIWDLTFTLIKENPWKAVKTIGYKTSILFGLQHGSKSSDILEKTILDVQKGYKAHGRQQAPDEIALDPKGNAQPPLMRQWFSGRKTSEEVRVIALDLAEKYDKYLPNSPLVNMFTRKNMHKEMVKGILSWMFTPEQYAHGQKVIEPARKLLKKCATFTDSQGNNKHECYILSNFDLETYNLIEKDPKFDAIFKYVKPEHRFISAKLHCIKPHHTIYECLLRETKLNPKDCILIDDQKENCAEAIKLGMDAVELKDDNYKLLEKELKQRGVFDQ